MQKQSNTTELAATEEIMPKELVIQNTMAVLLQEKKITLTDESMIQVKNSFVPFFQELAKWKKEALACKVTDVNQKQEMINAKNIRSTIRGIRLNADKTRKQLKEQTNAYNNGVQAIYNFIEAECTSLEEYTEAQEKFFEIQETKRKEELKKSRLAQLQPFNFQFDNGFNLGEMDDVMFNSLLAGVKKTYEDNIQAARKAEEEARVKEIQTKIYNERKENIISCWDYVPAKSKDFDTLVSLTNVEFVSMVAEAMKEKAKAEKELQELKKQKEAAELALKKEREAAKKIQDELKAKQEKEAQLKKQQEEEAEAKRKADEKAQKKAANAPDKAKLKQMEKDIIAFGQSLAKIELKSEESKKILSNTIILFGKVTTFVNSKTEEL